ncbi:hypothetical protein [Arcobacter sp. s6]|uniref:hypothetical protein n=1 Tax=Arcobacter sp. s6 TaxID=3230363 RepID=UPI0034A03CA2
MPQLIAMVIVVVGAMIYMFQTFGGTGDKIEGIAQKTSIITEINNIRNGLQLAVRAGDIEKSVTAVAAQAAVAADPTANPPVEAVPARAAIPAGDSTLIGLAVLGYFADQMNDEIGDNATTVGTYSATNNTAGQQNTYSAISFGGETNPGMNISMVVGDSGTRPGIRVQLLNELAGNAAFLESQIATDLASVASIDRTTVDGTAVTLDADGDVPAANASTSSTAASDGVFTVYFKDMPQNIVD